MNGQPFAGAEKATIAGEGEVKTSTATQVQSIEDLMKGTGFTDEDEDEDDEE